MSRVRGAIVVIVAVIGVLALTGITIARTWTPTIRADAATTVLATTVLTDDVPIDAFGGFDGSAPAMAPGGIDCPELIVRPEGTFHLCWEVYRDANVGDPDQDYYHFRVHGSFGGETGTGVRWAVLRARLIGQPSNEVFMTWPRGTVDGPCSKVDVDAQIMSSGQQSETICGRTIGWSYPSTWTHTATWVCVGCLIPNQDYHAIAIDEYVAVPEGTVPSWQIFGDIGS